MRSSPLVEQGRQTPLPTPWWLALLVVMIILVWVPPLGVALGNTVLGDPAPASGWYPYVGAFGSAAVLLALWLWVRVKEGRPLATVGFRPRRGWLRLLAGFGIGAAMMSVGVVGGLIVGAYRPEPSGPSFTAVDAALQLLPLALLCLFQACCQLALVPGYLLQTTLGQLPGWLAIIGSSLLVAVLHSLNPLSMLNLVLFAVFAALVALRQGSLWLVVGIQGGWTCFQSGVFGLPVGGISPPAALFTLGPAPTASTAVSGGQFGLGTSLIATGVLAVAVVIPLVHVLIGIHRPSKGKIHAHQGN